MSKTDTAQQTPPSLHATEPFDVLDRLEQFCKWRSKKGKSKLDNELVLSAHRLGGPLLVRICEVIFGYPDVIRQETDTFERFDVWFEKRHKTYQKTRPGLLRIVTENQGNWKLQYNPGTGEVFFDDGDVVELTNMSLVDAVVGFVLTDVTWEPMDLLKEQVLSQHQEEHPDQWSVFWDNEYLDRHIRIECHKTIPIFLFRSDYMPSYGVTTEIDQAIELMGPNCQLYWYG